MQSLSEVHFQQRNRVVALMVFGVIAANRVAFGWDAGADDAYRKTQLEVVTTGTTFQIGGACQLNVRVRYAGREVFMLASEDPMQLFRLRIDAVTGTTPTAARVERIFQGRSETSGDPLRSDSTSLRANYLFVPEGMTAREARAEILNSMTDQETRDFMTSTVNSAEVIQGQHVFQVPIAEYYDISRPGTYRITVMMMYKRRWEDATRYIRAEPLVLEFR